MMKNVSLPVIENFLHLVVQLSELKASDFSGVGLVFYNNLDVLSKYHCNLVNDKLSLPLFRMGTNDLVYYLTEISKYSHPYHDGFHFINGNGILTHVAQFFSPPISSSIPNISGQGARTFCSQCGSNTEGVIMVGSVSSSGHVYLFEKGELVNEKYHVAGGHQTPGVLRKIKGF